jgi:hypothetical protein
MKGKRWALWKIDAWTTSTAFSLSRANMAWTATACLLLKLRRLQNNHPHESSRHDSCSRVAVIFNYSNRWAFTCEPLISLSITSVMNKSNDRPTVGCHTVKSIGSHAHWLWSITYRWESIDSSIARIVRRMTFHVRSIEFRIAYRVKWAQYVSTPFCNYISWIIHYNQCCVITTETVD